MRQAVMETHFHRQHRAHQQRRWLHNSVNACDPTRNARMGLLSYAMTIGAIGVGLFALVRVHGRCIRRVCIEARVTGCV